MQEAGAMLANLVGNDPHHGLFADGELGGQGGWQCP
jgi:hypothetical protein